MAAKISMASLVLLLSFVLFACSREPKAEGPEVKVGTDGVSVTFDAEDLAKLAANLKNLAAIVQQIKQLAPPADPGQDLAKLPEPPAGAPKPPAGLPGPPSGPPRPPGPPGAPSLPGTGGSAAAKPPTPGALPAPGGPPSGPPEIPQELRNRMGLEVESLLGFLEDPDTQIPGKDHLGRIVDLTTSGTGQFSAQELDELEGEVQAMLAELGDSGSEMGVEGLVPVPGPGPAPGGPGPAPGPGPGGPAPGPGPRPPGS